MSLDPPQADNFFMSYELADFLLTEIMAVVSTVNLNKPERAALFLNEKQSLSFCLCCISDLTLLSYVPVRNKTVIPFS